MSRRKRIYKGAILQPIPVFFGVPFRFKTGNTLYYNLLKILFQDKKHFLSPDNTAYKHFATVCKIGCFI